MFFFFSNITICVRKGQIDSRKNNKQLKNYVQILTLIVNVQCEIFTRKFLTQTIYIDAFLFSLKFSGIEKFANIVQI